MRHQRLLHYKRARHVHFSVKAMRLHRFLAQCGVASRRRAELLIEQGKVVVNGKTASTGTKINPENDIITVEGKVVRPEERGIILLNKPAGVISSRSDPHGRVTVMSFLSKKYKSYYPVGRLDYDSEGLVIMTNDGDLAEKLLHPRYGLKRTYEVIVEGFLTEGKMAQIERGVEIDSKKVKAYLTFERHQEDQTILRISIFEGRNRIIRRLFEKVGYPVARLKRISHGPFRLPGIRTGQIKKLSQREYETLRQRALQMASGERNGQNGKKGPG